MNITKPKTVDEYIELAPASTKERLKQIRSIIFQVNPAVQECISYDMPAYKLNGILLYFGGFTKHISLFPTPKAIEVFSDELKDYKTSKGTVQFSNNKALPIDLIRRIVQYRIKENLKKTK